MFTIQRGELPGLTCRAGPVFRAQRCKHYRSAGSALPLLMACRAGSVTRPTVCLQSSLNDLLGRSRLPGLALVNTSERRGLSSPFRKLPWSRQSTGYRLQISYYSLSILSLLSPFTLRIQVRELNPRSHSGLFTNKFGEFEKFAHP